MLHSVRGEPFLMEKELLQLDGADLQWWQLTPNHASLGMKILGLTSEIAYLAFAAPDYVDTPLLMHDVRVRAATESSLEALRQRLNPNPGFFANYLQKMPWKEVVHIDCMEGRFFIRASRVEIHVGAIPLIESLERSKNLIRYSGVDPATLWR